MAVSSITSLSFSQNELIQEAFDVIGVGSEGEAISADMYRRGANSLNLMILSWNAMENLWRRETISVPLVGDQVTYAITPKPMRVEAARRKTTASGYETPMTEWSRREYLDQSNKASPASTPVNFYYDPQRDTGTLYVWPAPQTAVAAANTIEADVLRPMFLMDSSADTLDFPAEWQETVVMNLAQRLKLKYPVNDPVTNAQIDAQAATLFAVLKAWDNEPASIFLQPERRLAWR